jgi:hypothetical protein
MPAPKSLYSVHPSVERVRIWAATLAERSGHTLDEWVAIVRDSGPPSDKERREWLRKEHALSMPSADWIVERAAGQGGDMDSPEAYLQAAHRYVEEMFGGGKAALRPIYDALLKLGLGLGKDVKACPCRTIVPLYREHVFAQIKPATRTRIDLGFALGARAATGSLISTGGYAKKDRITHRIPISSVLEISDEVKKWLSTAYEEDR